MKLSRLVGPHGCSKIRVCITPSCYCLTKLPREPCACSPVATETCARRARPDRLDKRYR